MTKHLDFTPLEDAVNAKNDGALANTLGINRRSIYVYRKEGLNSRAADRLATRAGFHISELWPDYQEALLSERANHPPYPEVARLYLQLKEQGVVETHALIAATFGVDRWKIGKWIMRCRRLGLIPPVERHRDKAVSA